MNRVNAVLLVGDFRLKSAIAGALKKEAEIQVNSSCLNMEMAQNCFIKNVPNVLVLDMDTHNLEQRFLKALTEKYMLFIIVLAKRLPFFDTSIQYVTKPASSSPEALSSIGGIILQKVKSIAQQTPSFAMRDIASYVNAKSKLIAIAASTGGTEALPAVLTQLPQDIAPIVIVQHMPSMFTKQFADRVDKISVISVKEAQSGEMIKKGCAYIAPGDLHMRLVIRQQNLAVECFYADKMHGVRPSADILFESVAKVSGANAIGVILTGMGADGARGLVEMRQKGSVNIGQDKESCVVYGMPKAAYELGAVDHQVPLKNIAGKLVELSK